MKTRNIILCSLFASLITVGAFIKIPIPLVPFTLQFLITNMAGLLLGSKLGFVSVMIYVVLGLLGVPVFAQGGGISYVLQPSFGYLIGFAVGAFVTGKIAELFGSSFKVLLTASFSGLFIVYTLGMIYYALISNLYLGNPIGLWPLFLYCFILAVPGDIVLCFVSAYLGMILRRIYVENSGKSI